MTSPFRHHTQHFNTLAIKCDVCHRHGGPMTFSSLDSLQQLCHSCYNRQLARHQQPVYDPVTRGVHVQTGPILGRGLLAHHSLDDSNKENYRDSTTPPVLTSNEVKTQSLSHGGEPDIGTTQGLNRLNPPYYEREQVRIYLYYRKF